MIQIAKDASRLGMLIPPNGTRLPITGLQSEGTTSVTGIYLGFETATGATIAFGYSPEDSTPTPSEVWENAAVRYQAQAPLAVHFGS